MSCAQLDIFGGETIADDRPRYLGRCKCGKAHVRHTDDGGPRVRLLTVCGCGRHVELSRVQGEYNPGIACDARCMGAIGPKCSCSCGGRNHGGRYG